MKRLLSSVLVSLAGINCIYVSALDRPKLVVGIIIDQLRTDYLENLNDKFTSGGFKRLMDNGLYVKDIDFKIPNIDEASATAIIQTGAYPRQNGVTNAKVYDISNQKVSSTFNDTNYIGNFTEETYSPASLRVTTLSDEIALDGDGKSSIHSIAPNAESAIILAGHSGSSAFWLTDESGKWASTTYYSAPPEIAQKINYNNPLLSRLDTLKWIPIYSADSYKDISQDLLTKSFKYTFSKSDRDVFKYFKESPVINSDITEIAKDYIQTLKLGKNDEAYDVLNIGYTLAPFSGVNSGNGKYELEDSYLRLDRDLESLFQEIDKNIGIDNVLVYVVSTGYFTEPERDAVKYKLPSGSFSVKRAISLINAYLAAKYGNGSYVDRYFEGHIYLDKPSLEERNLDAGNVAQEARDFLVRMSGVKDAYTIADLQSPSVSQLEGHRLGNDPKTSGDIIVEFIPGWKVIDDSRFPTITGKEKTLSYPSPAFIFGGGISPKIIDYSVDATTLAPTIARTLRIRSPNSSVSKPLSIN